MGSSLAVRSRGTTKYFGDVVALDGVDLDIPRGQVHGLVGPNGAGKTTLLGLLLGLSVADEGSLEILGSAGRPGARGARRGGRFRRRTRSLPHADRPAEPGRARGLRGYGSERGAEVDHALEQVGLLDVADDRVRGFSLGMRQRLGLAAALLTKPRLLVLDEPSNGLDPAAKRHVHRVLADLAAAGRGGRDLEPPDGRPRGALLRGHAPRPRASGVLRLGDELAAESGRLDYRVLTSDADTTRRVVAGTPRARAGPRRSPLTARGGCVVARGPVSAVDDLVVRLVGAGVAVRELGPVVPPLEAAFLALTGVDDSLASQGAAR